MHQLGLSAADLTLLLHREREGLAGRLDARTTAHRHLGLDEARARENALCDLVLDITSALLEANNRKLAVDLVRLGVLTGTITREGDAAF